MQAESGPERILVVDDNPDICNLLTDVLKSKGYETVVCTNPADALEISGSESYGLAFVDINLPGMSGLDLAPKLRQRRLATEVVFITGSGMLEHAVQAIKLGANDFLCKPFSISDLVICLKRYEERKYFKEQIRLAEKRYLDLVHGLPLLIFVLRNNLTFDFVNQACLSILGFTPDEIIDVPDMLPAIIHEEDRVRVLQLFKTMFDSGGPGFSMDCRLVHKNGRLVHAIIKAISSRRGADDSGVEYVEGAVVDITDRVFLEKALVQREKLKTLGAISAEVAHEIRNPLVAIGGFTRRLQKKGLDQPELDIILNESERLERMLERIRNYLKPPEVHLEDCSLNAVVENSLSLLSPEIERSEIELLLDLSPNMSPARVNREVLAQVCINLIRNAVEAAGRRGTLKIRTLEGGHNFYIEFRNRSTKPPLKDPESLFLPFEEGGQSIGLPLCNRLLKMMEGTLSYSDEQGEVAFTVSLPKADFGFRDCVTIPQDQCYQNHGEGPSTNL